MRIPNFDGISPEVKKFAWWLLAEAQGQGFDNVTLEIDVQTTRLEFMDTRATPNDPKLSDGEAWRGACPTVERTEDAPNVDAAPLVESTRRDMRSRSLERMVRRLWLCAALSYRSVEITSQQLEGTRYPLPTWKELYRRIIERTRGKASRRQAP